MRETLSFLEGQVATPRNFGSTQYYCAACKGPWRAGGGGLDHKPDCLITRLRLTADKLEGLNGAIQNARNWYDGQRLENIPGDTAPISLIYAILTAYSNDGSKGT